MNKIHRKHNDYDSLMELNPNNSTPLVSVCCLTYNQEEYIKDAIEGFLLQKTSFPSEVIIHDDASTDSTAQIVKRYADENPGLILPILQTENQYSQGGKPLQNFVWPRAQGKYIAICDGDDYWTDPLKLQKQVDFFETNPDCSICFHAVERVHENQPKKNSVQRPQKISNDSYFKMEDAILGGGGFMATSSIMALRKFLYDRPEWMDETPVGDLPLMLLYASKGTIGYIDDVMGAYRVMTKNSWTSTMKNPRKRSEHYRAILKMWNEFDKWTNRKYHKLVFRKKMINRCNYYKKELSSVGHWIKSII